MDPIKVTQARYYPHDDEVWQPGPEEGVLTLVDDGAISELQLDRIYVDTDCVEIGSITMSARGPDQEDAYGYEIDLDRSRGPAACRRVDHCGPRDRADHTRS